MKLPTKILHHDLSNLVLGEYLGGGVSRSVFRCALNEDYVIKRSSDAYSWQNVNEWEVWHYAQSTSMAKYLAPCVMISPCGIYLVQRYVENVRRDELPKTIPRIFIDQKIENYGMLDGRLVARDYGTMVSLVRSIKGRRKANWTPDEVGHGYDGETIK